MQGRFSNMMIVSDVDGTLAPEFQSFPLQNIEAARRFCEQGGFFTIATGRAMISAQKVIDLFGIKGPVILTNGGCIYDTAKQRYTYEAFLPATASAHLRKLITHPKLLEARVMSEDDTYAITLYRRADAASNISIIGPRHNCVHMKIDEAVKLRWRKILLITLDSDLAEFRAFVDSLAFDDVDFVASSDFYYEMMPKGINKGSGVLLVANQLGIARENIVAAGDYENDLAMLRIAGFSCAPQNALPTIKAEVDLVLCHCKDGLLAELVTHLERLK